MIRRRFCTLINSGYGSAKDRSTCDVDTDTAFLDALLAGGRIEPPTRKPVITFTGRIEPEDMPWCGAADVVSDRFRQILEEFVPGQVQFIDVEVAKSKYTTTSKYYIAHWLYVLDCIDMINTSWTAEHEAGDPVDNVAYMFSPPIRLRHDAIPDSVSVFRLRYEETNLVIDKSLVSRFRKRRITGPQYMEL